MSRKLTMFAALVVIAALTTAAGEPAGRDRGTFDPARAEASMRDSTRASGDSLQAAAGGYIAGQVTVPSGSPMDVCVEAIDFDFNFDGFTTPAANGSYTLGPLDPGEYNVLFTPCGDAELAFQYYPAQPDVIAAHLILVEESITTVGVDADMTVGGVLQGTATFNVVGAATTRPAEGVFAVLTDAVGFPTSARETEADGTFSLTGGRPGAEHAVSFVDTIDRFAFQYSDQAPSFSTTQTYVPQAGAPATVTVVPLDISFAGPWATPRVGDFTGDGRADILSFDDLGNWWLAVGGAGGFTFYPWEHFTSVAGWDPQLVGDFNGDGRDDIVNYHAGTGRWWVLGGGTDTPSLTLWATFTSKTGWGPQLVGDFNGDGRDDVVNYHEGTGRWWVNASSGSAFTPQLWSQFTTKSGWGPHLVADFNGDGRDDVLSYHAGSGRWWLNKSTGTAFSPELWATFTTKTGWSQHDTGDFNGDGRADFIVYHQGSGRWWVGTSTGGAFSIGLWATFTSTTGWTFHDVADFTGDGRSDMVSYHEGSGRWWVSVSSGSGFSLGLWNTYATTTGWSPVLVADFNGDGSADVGTYYQTSKAWWVNVSSGTGFTSARWLDID